MKFELGLSYLTHVDREIVYGGLRGEEGMSAIFSPQYLHKGSRIRDAHVGGFLADTDQDLGIVL
jgi:hypothetical protein